MNQSICSKTWIFMAVFTTALCLTSVVMAQHSAKIDPCSLLTKAEIQAVMGQSIGDGVFKANQGICQYKVGSMGVFSVLAKPAGPGETADKVMAELKKRKIAVFDASGIGDRSFFSSPGYGMVQLNTFSGSNYLIITIFVPGISEDVQKNATKKLMLKALTKI